MAQTVNVEQKARRYMAISKTESFAVPNPEFDIP